MDPNSEEQSGSNRLPVPVLHLKFSNKLIIEILILFSPVFGVHKATSISPLSINCLHSKLNNLNPTSPTLFCYSMFVVTAVRKVED